MGNELSQLSETASSASDDLGQFLSRVAGSSTSLSLEARPTRRSSVEPAIGSWSSVAVAKKVDELRLSEEERRQINDVLTRLDQVKRKEERRISKLQHELHRTEHEVHQRRLSLSSQEISTNAGDQCTLCGTSLKSIRYESHSTDQAGMDNSTNLQSCSRCSQRICTNCGCKHQTQQSKPVWICKLCQQKCQLMVRSGGWLEALKSTPKRTKAIRKLIKERPTFSRANSLSKLEEWTTDQSDTDTTSSEMPRSRLTTSSSNHSIPLSRNRGRSERTGHRPPDNSPVPLVRRRQNVHKQNVSPSSNKISSEMTDDDIWSGRWSSSSLVIEVDNQSDGVSDLQPPLTDDSHTFSSSNDPGEEEELGTSEAGDESLSERKAGDDVGGGDTPIQTMIGESDTTSVCHRQTIHKVDSNQAQLDHRRSQIEDDRPAEQCFDWIRSDKSNTQHQQSSASCSNQLSDSETTGDSGLTTSTTTHRLSSKSPPLSYACLHTDFQTLEQTEPLVDRSNVQNTRSYICLIKVDYHRACQMSLDYELMHDSDDIDTAVVNPSFQENYSSTSHIGQISGYNEDMEYNMCGDENDHHRYVYSNQALDDETYEFLENMRRKSCLIQEPPVLNGIEECVDETIDNSSTHRDQEAALMLKRCPHYENISSLVNNDGAYSLVQGNNMLDDLIVDVEAPDSNEHLDLVEDKPMRVWFRNVALQNHRSQLAQQPHQDLLTAELHQEEDQVWATIFGSSESLVESAKQVSEQLDLMSLADAREPFEICSSDTNKNQNTLEHCSQQDRDVAFKITSDVIAEKYLLHKSSQSLSSYNRIGDSRPTIISHRAQEESEFSTSLARTIRERKILPTDLIDAIDCSQNNYFAQTNFHRPDDDNAQSATERESDHVPPPQSLLSSSTTTRSTAMPNRIGTSAIGANLALACTTSRTSDGLGQQLSIDPNTAALLVNPDESVLTPSPPIRPASSSGREQQLPACEVVSCTSQDCSSRLDKSVESVDVGYSIEPLADNTKLSFCTRFCFARPKSGIVEEQQNKFNELHINTSQPAIDWNVKEQYEVGGRSKQVNSPYETVSAFTAPFSQQNTSTGYSPIFIANTDNQSESHSPLSDYSSYLPFKQRLNEAALNSKLKEDLSCTLNEFPSIHSPTSYHQISICNLNSCDLQKNDQITQKAIRTLLTIPEQSQTMSSSSSLYSLRRRRRPHSFSQSYDCYDYQLPGEYQSKSRTSFPYSTTGTRKHLISSEPDWTPPVTRKTVQSAYKRHSTTDRDFDDDYFNRSHHMHKYHSYFSNQLHHKSDTVSDHIRPLGKDRFDSRTHQYNSFENPTCSTRTNYRGFDRYSTRSLIDSDTSFDTLDNDRDLISYPSHSLYSNRHSMPVRRAKGPTLPPLSTAIRRLPRDLSTEPDTMRSGTMTIGRLPVNRKGIGQFSRSTEHIHQLDKGTEATYRSTSMQALRARLAAAHSEFNLDELVDDSEYASSKGKSGPLKYGSLDRHSTLRHLTSERLRQQSERQHRQLLKRLLRDEAEHSSLTTLQRPTQLPLTLLREPCQQQKTLSTLFFNSSLAAPPIFSTATVRNTDNIKTSSSTPIEPLKKSQTDLPKQVPSQLNHITNQQHIQNASDLTPDNLVNALLANPDLIHQLVGADPSFAAKLLTYLTGDANQETGQVALAAIAGAVAATALADIGVLDQQSSAPAVDPLMQQSDVDSLLHQLQSILDLDELNELVDAARRELNDPAMIGRLQAPGQEEGVNTQPINNNVDATSRQVHSATGPSNRQPVGQWKTDRDKLGQQPMDAWLTPADPDKDDSMSRKTDLSTCPGWPNSGSSINRQQQTFPTNMKSPSNYDFPIKRLLLIRETKGAKKRDLGLRVVGGHIRPDGKLGAFVEELYPGSIADQLHGEIREGDEILEWNSVSLIGKSFEEVQSIIDQSSGETEIVVRVQKEDYNPDLSRSPPLSNSYHHQTYRGEDRHPDDHQSSQPRRIDALCHHHAAQQAMLDLQPQPMCPHMQQHLMSTLSTDSMDQPEYQDEEDNEPITPMRRRDLESRPRHNNTTTAPRDGSDSGGEQWTSKQRPKEAVNRSDANFESDQSTRRRRDKRDNDESDDLEEFGEIELILTFDDYDQSLTIHVARARDLPPMDLNGLADPFVKLRLHPDPTEDPDFNRQTKYMSNTLTPEWQQTLVFMNCFKRTLKRRVLEITVMDFDRLKSNDFMGQALINLGDRSLIDGRPHWFTLRKMQEVILPSARKTPPSAKSSGSTSEGPKMPRTKSTRESKKFFDRDLRENPCKIRLLISPETVYFNTLLYMTRK